MSICEIRNLLLIAMVTSVCACERKNSDVAEVETDMTEVSNWLTGTDKTAIEFGNSLAAKISKLRDRQQQDKYRARLESTLFSSRFETVDYNERFRRVGIFCDLIGSCLCDPSQHDRNIFLSLRRLGKVQDELNNVVVKAKMTVDDMMLDCYVCKLTTTVNSLAEQFERLFNERVAELSIDQRTSVLKDFAQIMGRPIRTNEEMIRDKQRKIDTQIDAARRRQEERLGNDVRVDIDSL